MTLDKVNQKLLNTLYDALSKIDKEVVRKHIKTVETDYDEETKKPCLEKTVDYDEISIKETVPNVANLKTLTEQIVKINEVLKEKPSGEEVNSNLGVVILQNANSLEAAATASAVSVTDGV